MKLRLAWLAAAMLAAPLRAEAAALPAWNGVWQGTIGTLPVQACLQHGSGDWVIGVYYYLSKKQAIRLERLDSGEWSEMPPGTAASTGTWRIEPAGGQLKGEWRQGERRLPISLAPVPLGADDAERPCGSRAFIAPRIEPVKIVAKPQKLGSFAYTAQEYRVGRSFGDVSIGSFAYPPSQPGDHAINARLKLDPNREGNEADYASCLQGSLGSLGTEGDFQFGYDPVEATARFLTVRVSTGGFCGGAHPSYGYNWRTYDRRTGKALVPGRWFKPQALPSEYAGGEDGNVQVSEALRRVFLRRFRFDSSECRDAASQQEFWNIGLTAKGLIVSPSLPHAIQACGDDAVVPFADLAPYLSTAGKTEMVRLGLARGGK